MKISTYNQLSKYESYLYSANYAGYIRSLTTVQVEELIKIGEEIGIIFKNNHCPKCTLNFVKRLAVPYFEQKHKLEEKKNGKNKNATKETVEDGSKEASDN